MNIFEHFAHPPSGGYLKLFILGIILPGAVGYFGWLAWTTGQAAWFDSKVVEGLAAQSLAVAYSSLALFCHSRWFWGIVPVNFLFKIGTLISLLGLIAALGIGLYHLFTS
jgi:hypothetical protein